VCVFVDVVVNQTSQVQGGGGAPVTYTGHRGLQGASRRVIHPDQGPGGMLDMFFPLLLCGVAAAAAAAAAVGGLSNPPDLEGAAGRQRQQKRKQKQQATPAVEDR